MAVTPDGSAGKRGYHCPHGLGGLGTGILERPWAAGGQSLGGHLFA
jgi:hypothetical protein